MSSQALIRLAPEIVDPWRQALVRCTKLPRGMSPKTHGMPALMQSILRGEAKEVARLWTIFTQEREDLSRHLLSNKRAAVAYLLGFHLANAARAQLVLGRAHIRHPLARVLRELKGGITWHDLGCGTGAVAQVVMHNFIKGRIPLSHVAMHLSDMSGTLLETATQVFAAAGWGDSLHTHKYPLEKISPIRLAPEAGTGLIGYSLGYVWNELARNKAARAALLRVFEERANQGHAALVLILEPAMQELARETMQLRDSLTSMGYGVLYPCPQSGSCPMLERSRDWCYSEGQWDAPTEILRLDEMLDMDRRHLSSSGYLLASPALMEKMAQEPKNQSPSGPSRKTLVTAIVVGRPNRTTGPGFDYLVCEPSGLDKVPHTPGAAPVPRGLPIPKQEDAAAETKPNKKPALSQKPATKKGSPASNGPKSAVKEPRRQKKTGSPTAPHKMKPKKK